jgi:PAS domain S-box-containing protein
MRRERLILAGSAVFGLTYWVFDGLVDRLAYHEGPFWQVLLFGVPPQSLLVRAAVLVLFLSFGLMLSVALGRERHMQARLREASARFDTLIQNTPSVAVQGFDRQGALRYWNRTSESFYGFRAEEVLGRRAQDLLLSGEQADQFEQSLREVWASGRPPLPTERTVTGADGAARQVYSTMLPVVENGKVVEVLCLNMDVTDRKQAEQGLRDSRRSLETLMSNLPGMAYRCGGDPAGSLEFVSVGCVELTGYGPEELLHNASVSYRELAHPEDRPAVLEAVEAARKTGRPFEITYRIRTKGGEERTVWEKGRAVCLEDGRLGTIEGFVADITERRRAEERLRRQAEMLEHSARLESVGRLAGGIAHDFNNLLTGILGYADFVLSALPPQSSSRQDVEEIKKAGQRAAALTHQLLTFSRRQLLEPKPRNLNAVVADMDRLLRRVIGEDVRLVTVLASDLGTIKADSGQLEQVIMNLAVNARDAMPKGGELTIETANVELDEAYAETYPPTKPGSYVMLAVSDNGVGMDEATREHIFEPFFTTKPPGTGTGLGMATVYGIVKQHGGYIWVYSEPGHGTCVKVYLPLVQDAVGPEPEHRPPSKMVAGTETILVLEDEEAVRDIVRRTLEGHGYKVLVAGSAVAAKRLMLRDGAGVDLLLSDVVVRDARGPDLYAELEPGHPGLKVLYMSGYTAGSGVLSRARRKGSAFLPKPFTPETLLHKVRQVLDLSSNDQE